MDETQDNQIPQARSDARLREERSFLHYAILFYGVGLLFLLVAGVVWFAADVLLVVFACILVAVLLYDIVQRVQRWLHLPHGPTLALAVVLLLAVLGVAGWLMAPQVARQAGDLMTIIPQAIDRVRAAGQQYPLLRSLLASLPPTDQLVSRAASMLSQAGLVFSGVLGAVGNIAIIVFVGIYLAAQPRVYIDGIVTLMPHRKRQRVQQVFSELGRTLGQWLVGKFVTMVIVGIAIAFGLSLLGLPLALVLGILAGLLDFIPYLGPIIAGGPAVLIAFSESPILALYVALATLLTAVLTVLVTMLYVQDVLGDPVKTPSEH